MGFQNRGSVLATSGALLERSPVLHESPSLIAETTELAEARRTTCHVSRIRSRARGTPTRLKPFRLSIVTRHFAKPKAGRTCVATCACELSDTPAATSHQANGADNVVQVFAEVGIWPKPNVQRGSL